MGLGATIKAAVTGVKDFVSQIGKKTTVSTTKPVANTHPSTFSGGGTRTPTTTGSTSQNVSSSSEGNSSTTKGSGGTKTASKTKTGTTHSGTTTGSTSTKPSSITKTGTTNSGSYGSSSKTETNNRPQASDYMHTGNKTYDNAYNSVISNGGSKELAVKKAGEAMQKEAKSANEKVGTQSSSSATKPAATYPKPAPAILPNSTPQATDFMHTGNSTYDNAYNSVISNGGSKAEAGKKASEAMKKQVSGGKTGTANTTPTTTTKAGTTPTTKTGKTDYMHTGNATYDNAYNSVISNGGSKQDAANSASEAMKKQVSGGKAGTGTTNGNTAKKPSQSDYVHTGNTFYDNAYNSIISQGGNTKEAINAVADAMRNKAQADVSTAPSGKVTPIKNDPNKTMNDLTARYKTQMNSGIGLDNQFVYNSGSMAKFENEMNGVINSNNLLIADIEKQQVIYREDSTQWQELNKMKLGLKQSNNDTRALIEGVKGTAELVKNTDNHAYNLVATFNNGELSISKGTETVYTTSVQEAKVSDKKERTAKSIGTGTNTNTLSPEMLQILLNFPDGKTPAEVLGIDESSRAKFIPPTMTPEEYILNLYKDYKENKDKYVTSPTVLTAGGQGVISPEMSLEDFNNNVLSRVLDYEYSLGPVVLEGDYGNVMHGLTPGTLRAEGTIDLATGTFWGDATGVALKYGRGVTESQVLNNISKTAYNAAKNSNISLETSDLLTNIAYKNNVNTYAKTLERAGFTKEASYLRTNIKPGVDKLKSAKFKGGMLYAFGVDELMDAYNVKVEYDDKYQKGELTANQVIGGMTGEMTGNTMYNLAEAAIGTGTGTLAVAAGVPVVGVLGIGFAGAVAAAVEVDGITYLMSGGEYSSFVDLCGDFGAAIASNKDLEQRNKQMDAEIRLAEARIAQARAENAKKGK